MKRFKKYQPYLKRFGILGLIEVLVIIASIANVVVGNFGYLAALCWIFNCMLMERYNNYIKFSFLDPIKPAMNVLYKAEARKYLNDYTIYLMYHKKMSTDDARKLIRDNIGYFAGYYDHETAERMERLFGAIHPILGTVADRRNMTPQEIIQLGIKHAKVNLK